MQVIKLGISNNEALGETNHPCSKTHVYHCVQVAQERFVEAAKEGVNAIVEEVAIAEQTKQMPAIDSVSIDPSQATNDSSMTPPSASASWKGKQHPRSELACAALKRIKEGGEVRWQDTKTIKQVE